MEVKRLALRWPDKLAKGMEAMAKRKNTSAQTLITEAVLDKYEIENWRTGTQKEVEEILKIYDYVPEDIAEAVRQAKISLGIGPKRLSFEEFLQG